MLLPIEIFTDNDIEVDETLIITLDDEQNVGANHTSIITISEVNLAPAIHLAVFQSGEERLTVARDEGAVEMSATVTDLNPQDSVQMEWVPPADVVIDSLNGDTLIFDPSTLPVGLYEFALFAIDDGEPVLSNTESVFIDVVDTLAVLDDMSDADGDLIPDAEEGYADSDGDGIPDYLDAIADCNVMPEQAINQDIFLVESDPGACMRQGTVANSNSSEGLQVVLDTQSARQQGLNALGVPVRFATNNLPEDTAATNVGGVFDFIVYDLPEVGQSVNVVLPQVQPIPPNAVYRKYKATTQSWVGFVSNDANEVFSAPGEQGFCPPPGAEVWVAGLNEGDWCVQLRIEDGGPNDDDEIANGTVVDPGGVAVVLNNNSLPVINDDTVSMPWNTAIDIDVLANDSDSDGDVLVISHVSVGFGDVVLNSDNTLRYTPDVGFVGADTIVYTVSDGNAGSGSGTVHVSIIGNRAPVAVADIATTDDITPLEIDVLSNDQDVDGDVLTLQSAVARAGSVSVTAEHTLLYTPPLVYTTQVDGVSADSITYVVSDSAGATAQGTVTVNVTSSNRAPQALDDEVTTGFETAITIDVLVNDSDADDDVLVVESASSDVGNVVINADSRLTYTPPQGFEGVAVIDYTLSDGALTANAQVFVTVEPEPIEVVKVVNRSSGGSVPYWVLVIGWLILLVRQQQRRYINSQPMLR